MHILVHLAWMDLNVSPLYGEGTAPSGGRNADRISPRNETQILEFTVLTGGEREIGPNFAPLHELKFHILYRRTGQVHYDAAESACFHECEV